MLYVNQIRDQNLKHDIILIYKHIAKVEANVTNSKSESWRVERLDASNMRPLLDS